MSQCEQATAKNIADFICNQRESLSNGRTTGNGAMQLASEETWKAIEADSEAYARRQLLANSAALKSVDAAEPAAKKAEEEAAAKSAELQAIWSELNGITSTIAALEARIDDITAELKTSSLKSAEARLKDLLAQQVRGTQYHSSHIIEAATAVVIARTKADVLEEYRVELRNQLAELKRREAELTKKLS
jgi:hypothetical protein